MLIAIIYTGEIRTNQKTIPYFKQNVLLNDNYHIFATLQHPYDENIRQNHENYITYNLSNNLKSLQWLYKNDTDYNNVIQTILNNNWLPHQNIYYLLNSGSIIEYYQAYLSFCEIQKYEKKHNIRYNYIIRVRTDVIINKKLDFDFLYFSKYRILQRLKNISKKLNIDNKFDTKCLTLFMNSLIDNRRIYADLTDLVCLSNDDNFKKIKNIKQLKNYILHGNYIITLRKNVFFLINRDYYSNISILGLNYGLYKDSYFLNQEYWWNSESQFQSICIHYNTTYFNSTTLKEDLSLYQYDNNNYFDENNELKTNDKNILFFICRN